LLRGYYQYRKRGGTGKLYLVKKGQDVGAAESLIRDLGITEHIIWIDEMPLRDFYAEMKSADLICDQFGSSFPGMTAADAWAMGKPVLANPRKEVFEQHTFGPLPGIHVRTPPEIAEAFFRAECDKTFLRELGLKSREFAERY